MLNIASVHVVRRASSAVYVALLAALFSACVHATPPAVSKPKTWVVENVTSKSTAELYADAIAPALYERSSSKELDGYTVESGNLVMPDKSIGSLVTVRSKDGSLTAVVEKAGESGLLVINSNGESHFTPYPVLDYSLPDTVIEKTAEKSITSVPAKTAGPYVIDMLVGYSRAAVEAVGGDAQANALAQVESVNLALQNSLVTNVSLRLAGIQVVEQEYPITPDTLNALPQIFSSGISMYQPDMVYGVFAGHVEDSAVGWAHVHGRYAIGWVYGEAFRHEVGHNAGGLHCAISGGAPVPYGYGHSYGITSTAQCGNGNPYYSTPDVRDAYGYVIGDAVNADMARVWRENAERLSSYVKFVPKAPTSFKVVRTLYNQIDFEWGQSFGAAKYEIWGSGFLVPLAKYGESTVPWLTMRNMPDKVLQYYVVAFDSAGAKSPISNIVLAKPGVD
jgi:hypothetical protein